MLDVSQIAPERLRALRRNEYEGLVENGAFTDERIELLAGALIEMTPPGAPHADVVGRLTMILAPALVGRAVVRVQSPLALSDESEPEPDLAVVPPGDSVAVGQTIAVQAFPGVVIQTSDAFPLGPRR